MREIASKGIFESKCGSGGKGAIWPLISNNFEEFAVTVRSEKWEKSNDKFGETQKRELQDESDTDDKNKEEGDQKAESSTLNFKTVTHVFQHSFYYKFWLTY